MPIVGFFAERLQQEERPRGPAVGLGREGVALRNRRPTEQQTAPPDGREMVPGVHSRARRVAVPAGDGSLRYGRETVLESY